LLCRLRLRKKISAEARGSPARQMFSGTEIVLRLNPCCGKLALAAMARAILRLQHINLSVGLLVTALAHLHVRNPARRTANDSIFPMDVLDEAQLFQREWRNWEINEIQA
jgi:hypothetical protein